jgi:hypothetical protein
MIKDDPRRVGDEDYKAFDYPDYDEDYCGAAKAAQERADAMIAARAEQEISNER